MKAGRLLSALVALCAPMALGCMSERTPAPHSDTQATPTSPQASKPTSVDHSQAIAKKLRAAHERADKATTKLERAMAARALEKLFSELPGGSPHLVAVRQDLAARAATLLLENAPLESKRLAEAGLALSDAPTVLRANLFIALADAQEALGSQQAARGALIDALAINEQLFESELENP